ncbi:MAG: SMP-30/gluconolactonase/LRE family protein [Telluria sp.]
MKAEKFEAVHDAPMQVGECPVWHAVESALYWVDIDGKAVHRLHPASGKHTLWPMPSEPSALALMDDNELVVALRTGFARLNTTTGTLTPRVAAPYDQSHTRFNDGRVDPAGRFWVGTRFEKGADQLAEMYVLERGALRLAWSGGMTNSNGLAWSRDGKTMYHADTTAHRVDAYDFDAASGAYANKRTFASFDSDKKAPGYGGRPDGATVDAEDCYWVAMYEGARVLRFAPDGKLLRELKVPVKCPTAVCFGGPGLHTLYITSAAHGRPAEELAQYPLTGKVLAVRLDVAGREEPLYRA